jgi:[acyl-carrier-protein] S-malonyltransferase
MGVALAEAFPTARRTLAEVDDVLGTPLSRLCAEGPADVLARTEHAQPAILGVSVAAWRVLREETGLDPVAVAGHSLGEWSALVAAGALSLADAARGVRERGRLMQDAVPVGVGAMAAVMGLEAAAVETLCAQAAEGEVLVPANLNGAGQVVVAGHAGAVARLVALAKAQRARAQALDVSAPFHCPLMAPAAEGLARWLEGVAIRDPERTVVTSVEARPVRDAADVRALLVAQVTAPVRWEATVAALDAFGAAVAVEPGPGKVLTALHKRMRPDVRGLAVGDLAGLAEARELLA